MNDVLAPTDWQKTMAHPEWVPRANPDVERNIAELTLALLGSKCATVANVDEILRRIGG
jgi:hypothetical protein